ncbi:hypothetical protein ABE530_17475 [Brucella sp. TWI559]
MSISIQTGSAHLICDSIYEGNVEYSIAVASDGPDLNMRGKVWGSKSAIAKAINGTSVSLNTSGQTTIEIKVEELDRDGSALFTVNT